MVGFFPLHLFLRNAHTSFFGSPVASREASLATALKLCGLSGTTSFPSSVGLIVNNTLLEELHDPVLGEIRTKGALLLYASSWKHFMLME